MTVAGIISYSAFTDHGNIMTLGLRDTVRVVGEEKNTKIIDGKYFEISTVSEKNSFLRFLELFLI